MQLAKIMCGCVGVSCWCQACAMSRRTKWELPPSGLAPAWQGGLGAWLGLAFWDGLTWVDLGLTWETCWHVLTWNDKASRSV